MKTVTVQAHTFSPETGQRMKTVTVQKQVILLFVFVSLLLFFVTRTEESNLAAWFLVPCCCSVWPSHTLNVNAMEPPVNDHADETPLLFSYHFFQKPFPRPVFSCFLLEVYYFSKWFWLMQSQKNKRSFGPGHRPPPTVPHTSPSPSPTLTPYQS